MAGAGLQFTVAAGYEVEEVYPADTPARKVPEYLARLKSNVYPQALADDEILITADTVVILDEAILGKPKDRDEAIGMISRLSGREHVVITGVCIRDRRRTKSFAVGSRVTFRELRREEIEYYVDTYKPFDKAGAYAIQEWIGFVGVRGVKGSFYNVMGLPIQTLYVELKKFL
jgi:septum formation protein